uniref:Uncharacterized protein n=1 Tax=Cacopsylla melanoneura TaxID=428564 RepID=A0A8D9E748_9HEMI
MSLPNGKWALESLHQYDGHKWTKTENKGEEGLLLFLQEDNMHITRGSTLVEQMCLSSDCKISKAFFHESTLGFVINRPQGITKFNVKFSPRCLNIDVCLKHIGLYMRVQMVNQGRFQEDTSMKTVVEKMLQKGPLTYLKGNYYLGKVSRYFTYFKGNYDLLKKLPYSHFTPWRYTLLVEIAKM